MDIINSENKKCTILGDMNIDLLKYNDHNLTNQYLDNIVSRTFVPMILKPTRITPTSATLIDHIYSNHTINSFISGIVVNDVADHFGTFHILKNGSKQTSLEKNEKRIFSEANINTFNSALEHTDFSEFHNISCPELAYTQFFNKYYQVFDIAFPKVTTKINRKYIKREPWVTTGLLTSMRTKDMLYRKKIKNPTQLNTINYKKYLNKYNQVKRVMKKLYYESKIRQSKNDMKATWQVINEAIGKSRNKCDFPHSFCVNNNMISDKTSIVQSFNKLFAEIGIKTSESIPPPKKHFKVILKHPIPLVCLLNKSVLLMYWML